MKRKLGGMVALALAIMTCLSGVALAKVSHAKAPVVKANSTCGEFPAGHPVIGTVSFKRVGNLVTVTVVLNHGVPNSSYEVSLSTRPCAPRGSPFTMTTNSKGVGKGSGSFSVLATDKEFFADPARVTPSVFEPNDTPFVRLR
ncbi:MAG TPA: hypothetical protein VG010_12510 [Solirubrobacteraceae bacterium]|jgi:hypothetical protein|nr:hypothetical protein [Solirubrobacteraceae bacterium]